MIRRMKSRYVAGAALIVTASLPVLSTGSASADAKIGPGERRCFTVEGEPGDAAVVNLTPVNADGAGNGKLVSSDVADPAESSNVNFRPGSADPNVAIALIGQDGKVCYINSDHTSVHLVADHLGTIAGDAYEPALPTGESVRLIDTRHPDYPRAIEPGGGLCLLSPMTGRVGFYNVTPTDTTGLGHGLLSKSMIDVELFASNVNYRPGGVDPNLGIVPLDRVKTGWPAPAPAEGAFVCYQNSEHSSLDLVLDLVGTVDGSVFTTANEYGYPVRRLDTRFHSAGKVRPNEWMCFDVEGEPGDAAIVNLTPVRADGRGNGQLVSSDLDEAPLASNVNFGPGTVDPNVAIATIGENGQVCFVNSEHTSVHVVADHLGSISAEAYTPASAGGTSVRVLDTRD